MELSTLLLERFLPEALQPLSGGCWLLDGAQLAGWLHALPGAVSSCCGLQRSQAAALHCTPMPWPTL